MPPRRRSSKSQPIRKRKNATRQVLAKVAERKEAYQQRMIKKVEDVDARINAARLSSLSIPLFTSGTRGSQTGSEAGLAHAYDGEDAEEEEEAEERANAYGKLVGFLSRPLHNEPTPKSAAVPRVANGSSSTKNMSTATPSRKPDHQKLPPSSAESTTREESIEEEDADVENRAAAIRENDHFTNVTNPPDSSSAYVNIVEFPNLRSSSSASKSATETLRALISEKKPISLGLQPSVLRNWQSHASYALAHNGQTKSPLLRGVAAALRAYHDVLLCASLDAAHEDAARALVIAHSVAHVLRCRARILRHDAVAHDDGVTVEDEATLRDQGFSRARVLIILPMRNIAYDVIKLVLLLAGGKRDGKGAMKFLNQDRFETDFAPEREDSDMAGDDELGVSDPAAVIRSRWNKPADYTRLFRGNVDDDFKMGISFAKKSIKLYSDFYDSDIIFASPLGLRRASAEKAAGHDKHTKVMREKRKREEDTEWKTGIDSKVEKRVHDENDNGFLSSIEICILDGANVLSMQNWDTLKRTVGMLNKMPSSTRETDFSRVREWCLEGLMSKFRQTIVLSRYRKSDTMALFREFTNHAGKVQLIEVPREHGSMSDVAVDMRQSFFSVDGVQSPADSSERRLKFFFQETFPAVRALVESQVFLIVPNYMDFVRVRNRLVKISEEDPSFRFASMCEYSRGKEVSRARDRFFDRTVSLVVMTERFHFYWRHWIRGGNTIVWFGLPENSQFYPEILNMTAEAAEEGRFVQSIALYDKFDEFCLERIVGQKRCRKMTKKTARSTYLFR